jgi:hypothetical protein
VHCDINHNTTLPAFPGNATVHIATAAAMLLRAKPAGNKPSVQGTKERTSSAIALLDLIVSASLHFEIQHTLT